MIFPSVSKDGISRRSLSYSFRVGVGLKIRASYGRTGNDRLEISQQGAYMVQLGIAGGKTDRAGKQIRKSINPQILGIWIVQQAYRLLGSFHRTKDLLLDLPVLHNGFTAATSNVER